MKAENKSDFILFLAGDPIRWVAVAALNVRTKLALACLACILTSVVAAVRIVATLYFQIPLYLFVAEQAAFVFFFRHRFFNLMAAKTMPDSVICRPADP
jgi:hypothetical protein